MTKKSTISPEISAIIDDLVVRYYGFGKASVKGILGLAETVRQAKDELGDKYLATFYERIKVKPDGSTYRKLIKIDSMRTRFEPVLDKLPNNWTTIYELAKLDDHEFRQLVDDDVLHPLVRWQTILDRFAKKRSAEDVEAPQRLILDITRVGTRRRRQFAEKLKALLDEFEVPLGKIQETTLESFFAVPNGTSNVEEGTNASATL